jgi:hypothetical protein
MLLRTSPEKFATEFNLLVPGLYRRISVQDVRDMTECGLIGKYSCYGHTDVETVRAILRYEKLREERERRLQHAEEAKVEPPRCNGCGQPLPDPAPDKKGRRKEYCAQCEMSRPAVRYRRWHKKKAGALC